MNNANNGPQPIGAIVPITSKFQRTDEQLECLKALILSMRPMIGEVVDGYATTYRTNEKAQAAVEKVIETACAKINYLLNEHLPSVDADEVRKQANLTMVQELKYRAVVLSRERRKIAAETSAMENMSKAYAAKTRAFDAVVDHIDRVVDPRELVAIANALHRDLQSDQQQNPHLVVPPVAGGNVQPPVPGSASTTFRKTYH